MAVVDAIVKHEREYLFANSSNTVLLLPSDPYLNKPYYINVQRAGIIACSILFVACACLEMLSLLQVLIRLLRRARTVETAGQQQNRNELLVNDETKSTQVVKCRWAVFDKRPSANKKFVPYDTWFQYEK